MDLECFLYEVKDSVLVLTMHRPEVRNAWNKQMHEEYLKVLEKVNEDDSIRAVVLTGTPPAFSSGTDLKSLRSGTESFQSSLSDEGAGKTITLMRNFNKPIIAAINGSAVGMGITITFLCDIRIASESAKMCLRFTELGVIPEFASAYILPRLIGFGRAMELCLSARTFGAKEALDMGLVTKVVPDEQLLPTALEIARGIAAKQEHAIRKTREILYRYLDTDFAEAVRRDGPDFVEAVQKSFGGK